MTFDPASGLMVRMLMNRYHKKIAEAPVRFLPKDLQKAIMAIQVPTEDSSPLFFNSLDKIEAIHYSWLYPVIKDLPLPIRKPMLSVLPEPQADKLWKLLSNTSQKFIKLPLAQPIKKYFIRNIYRSVYPSGILPIPFLPENPLSFLLKMNKQQLVETIDFLGLYDLAESIRHIIDKNFLQKLYKCLSNKQRQFLRMCLHQQEKIVTVRMEMSTWDGSCKKLDLMLQRRGLLRFGKSLCGLPPDFVWYIAHILDSGRGSLILKYFTPEASPGVTARLVQQVITLSNFLKPKSTP